MRRWAVFAAGVLFAASVGCGKESQAEVSTNGKVVVFAAASLKEAVTDLAQEFEATHPGTHVNMSFGGSQDLALHIKNGALANVFVSADFNQLTVAGSSGRVQQSDVHELAQNSLAVVAWPKSHIHTLQDLTKPNVRIVLAGSQVPVGNYGIQMLHKLNNVLHDPDFTTKVGKNVKSWEQSVSAVLSKVELGEADAGIVYTTDAAQSHGKVRAIPIPPEANVVSKYWITRIDQWYEGATSFVNFTLSPPGQKILAKHGFQHPSK